MKVKKNVTPVAELLITPNFVENGTNIGPGGVDATENYRREQGKFGDYP